MPNRDYQDERRDYNTASLSEEQLDNNPFLQFTEWMDKAHQSSIKDPTAMSLSTCDVDGQPHSRIVLLKEIHNQQFIFYTHYDSDKGRELEINNKASLLFFWPELDQQIRIEGSIQKVSAEISDQYFHSRPRDSQLTAYISQQSRPVSSRKVLENSFAEATQKLSDQTVPRPNHWGGYRLEPHQFEFWQGRPNRLHDRFRYHRDTENHQAWSIDRLSP